MITAKINVTKIDKAKLFKGEKGVYLDIVLIEREDDKFGNDYMVVQSVTKEEREAGKKGNILGNAKIIAKKPTGAPAAQPAPKPTGDIEEDVPF